MRAASSLPLGWHLVAALLWPKVEGQQGHYGILFSPLYKALPSQFIHLPKGSATFIFFKRRFADCYNRNCSQSC